MCNAVVEKYASLFQFVPKRFLTQEMCNQAVKEDAELLENVPDCFALAQMVEKCQDEEWLRSYKKCKAHE